MLQFKDETAKAKQSRASLSSHFRSISFEMSLSAFISVHLRLSLSLLTPAATEQKIKKATSLKVASIALRSYQAFAAGFALVLTLALAKTFFRFR